MSHEIPIRDRAANGATFSLRASGATFSLRASGATVLAAAFLVTSLAPAPASAQAPADAIFRDFELSGEFLFELAGSELEHAEIYHSDRASAYLVLAPELSSPVLINPRTQSVEAVHLMKVMKRPDGSIDLLADATFTRLSRLRISGSEVLFDVKGQPAKLKPKPPLLGFQPPAALAAHNPKYARLAGDYEPDGRHLEALRGLGKEARIRIYFGSWCSTCGRLVPRVLRIDDDLEGSKLEFEYYGLPHDIGSDPASERDDVHGVPTGIVYVDGKEVGRLGARELNRPEAALDRMLSGG